jgi:predicted regulator of Ras-like GTPase activity (Roadblock/LC7/MglB family)
MALSIREILNNTVESIEGTRAAGLVGTDGIAVEMVEAEADDREDTEANEEMVIELAGLMGALNRSASKLEGGKIKDFIINATDRTFIAAMVDKEYFMVVVLDAEGNLGRALFELKRAVGKMKHEV